MGSTTGRVVAAVAALLLVVGGVFGYRAVLDRRRADALAAAGATLATALTTGDNPGAVLDGAPDVRALLSGAADLDHRVDVVDSRVAGDQGLVQLRHVWTLRRGDPDHTYEVDAAFAERDGRWVAAWQPGLLAPGLREGERLRAQRTQPARADILDAAGQPIVTKRPVQRVGIDRSAVPKETAVASAARLAEALGLEAAPYVEAVGTAGDQAYVVAITLRDPSPELATAQALTLPGLLLQRDDIPLAPTASFARPILGTVGEATKEIVEKSDGRIKPGDATGLGGLQAAHDATLAGRAGEVLAAVPSGGGAPRILASAASAAGSPVRLTLDMRSQTAAEAVLAGVAPASALVAIRPSDGHVLAAASGPGGKGMSTATLGQYPPGSTMKAVTALALLRAGLTPASVTPCPATLDVEGRTFKNYDGYPTAKLGDITLRAAFAQSCNTAFMGQRAKLSESSLAEAAGALGLTAEPALGVPAALGTVPAPAGDTEKAASLIGQGRVVSSPLGMATVAASIAAGRGVAPLLVTSPAPTTGQPTQASQVTSETTGTPASPASPAKPVTAAEAAELRALLRAVVTEGNSPLLQGVPGGAVAAKSGTAEYGDATPPRTHAWMIAIQGDLAVAAFLEDAGGGAADAGPLVKSFLTRLAS